MNLRHADVLNMKDQNLIDKKKCCKIENGYLRKERGDLKSEGKKRYGRCWWWMRRRRRWRRKKNKIWKKS